MALSAGQLFAGYEILCELGRGGMGAVYQARQVALQRVVALKILPPHLAADESFLARFQAEAVAAANVSHPNIVQVYTAGLADGIEYIAMEYVEGETIQQRLRRCGRLPLTEALDIAYHVAEALRHAWETAQLIHRDVKPDNIFLSHHGTVKLGDFGLAKVLRDGAKSATVTGFVLGSAHFMSPEQARGLRDVDFGTDIYSLGCTLHYMMTGRTVFEGPDFMSVMYKHVNDAPEPIQTLLPNCPAAVNRLLTRMLAKDRQERPASYAELIHEIVQARSEADVWERSDERQQRRMALVEPPRNPSRRVYAVALLLAVVAAVTLVQGQREPRKRQAPSLQSLSDPSDRRDFVRRLERLGPVERIERVMVMLREVNPGFIGKEKYTVEGDEVTELTLSSAGLRNIWPLSGLPHLHVLNLAGDPAGKRRSELADIAVLAELPLEEVDISWTSVADLQPLAALHLIALRAANTRITSLAPLKGLPLSELDVAFTGVADLAPLKDMALESLRANDTRVSDLSPLRGMPLKNVAFDERLLRASGDTIRSWTQLETVNDAPPRALIERRLPGTGKR